MTRSMPACLDDVLSSLALVYTCIVNDGTRVPTRSI